MPRQRPAPHRFVGAVACLVLLAGLVAGCGPDQVPIDSPDIGGVAAGACGKLVDALPGSVSGQPRRPVQPADAFGAAWGDPPIVLRCGVPTPRGFDRFATCQVANGVGWFVPESQIEDQGADVVLTTIGFEQNVELLVPAGYRPPAAALVDVAEAIKLSIREVRPCV